MEMQRLNLNLRKTNMSTLKLVEYRLNLTKKISVITFNI
jgi:hypothetical protein